MNDYAQVFKGDDGQFYFHVRSSGNHEIISSSEGYVAKQDALDVLEAHFRTVSVVDLDEAGKEDAGV